MLSLPERYFVDIANYYKAPKLRYKDSRADNLSSFDVFSYVIQSNPPYKKIARILENPRLGTGVMLPLPNQRPFGFARDALAPYH